MGYFASGLHMTAGFQKMLPIGNSFIETYPQYADGFGRGNRIIVVLENKKGGIFQPDFLKTLNDATPDQFYTSAVARQRSGEQPTALPSHMVIPCAICSLNNK